MIDDRSYTYNFKQLLNQSLRKIQAKQGNILFLVKSKQLLFSIVFTFC